MTANNNVELQIRSIQEMAERMIVISEEGFATCSDDGCLLLNGMVRECAYRLRDAAEREREVHGLKGTVAGNQAARTEAEKLYDASITALVKTTLAAHRSTSTLQTEVETRNGGVTLTGRAGSISRKSLITKLVADINGVTSVQNLMTVKAADAGETGGSSPVSAVPVKTARKMGA